ncbi:MAG: hypothetical protein HZA88_04715 [Verrucomicrobia bacterium]|nr:hypothetical protein [Verrucomicrobiota bacterium]
MTVSLKKLSLAEWDAYRGDVDFHVRLENDEFFIDSFRSNIEDADKAHLTTFVCHSWQQVEAYLCDFNPETKLPETGYGTRHGHAVEKKPS